MVAVVDALARHLSEMTGTEFIVRRARFPEGMRYTLRAERDGHPYTFQAHRPIKLSEMVRWLASICDAVNMQFIPVAAKKPQRLLVFCGSRAAIERFDMAGWPIIAPQYPPEQRQEIIAAFRANPNGRLAINRGMLTGWRAPAETFVLFDPSWPYAPNSPESIQATMHVDRK